MQDSLARKEDGISKLNEGIMAFIIESHQHLNKCIVSFHQKCMYTFVIQ